MATNSNISIKIEDEDDVVEVGGVVDNSVWSSKNEAIFIDIMEEEVKTLGSRNTGTFQKECWSKMRKALIAKTSYPYTELQLRNKYNLLRTLHTKFASLVKQSGAGWDAEKYSIVADDALWEKLFQVNNKAKYFKKKGFKHYAAMSRILGDTTATGFNVHPSTKSPSRTDSSDPSFQIKQEEENDELEVEEVSGKGKKKAFDMKALKIAQPKESSKSRKRDSFAANLNASLSAIAESNKRKVDILEAKHNAKSSSVTVTSQDHGDSQGMLMECMAILNDMEDLDGPAYAKGLKLLKEDPSWRELFLKMPEKRKKDWILSL